MNYWVNDTKYYDFDVKIHRGDHGIGASERHGPFSRRESVLVAVNIVDRGRPRGYCRTCKIEIPETLPHPYHCNRCMNSSRQPASL